jgi:hypothetical protein
VDILAGKARTADVRRQALIAAVTIIGAVTMSRVVSDPKLSAEILGAARLVSATIGIDRSVSR